MFFKKVIAEYNNCSYLSGIILFGFVIIIYDNYKLKYKIKKLKKRIKKLEIKTIKL